MRHRMIEEKHQGHDLMHAEMILILFGSIMVAQVLLYVWRQRHPRSYTTITLLGLWAIPIVFSVRLFFWKMIIVWTLFSAITIFVMYKATRKKISVNTPRSVCVEHVAYFEKLHTSVYIIYSTFVETLSFALSPLTHFLSVSSLSFSLSLSISSIYLPPLQSQICLQMVSLHLPSHLCDRHSWLCHIIVHLYWHWPPSTCPSRHHYGVWNHSHLLWRLLWSHGEGLC